MQQTEIIPIKNDLIFHDLINEEDMDVLEWIAMQILGASYEEIHGNVTIQNIRLPRRRHSERSKYVDLKIKFNYETIVIELNCNYNNNPLRNIEYATSVIGLGYDNYEDNENNYLTPIRGILVNLNWYPKTATRKKREIPGKTVTLWNYPENTNFDGYYLKIIDVNLDYWKKVKYNSIKKENKFYKLLTVDNKKDLDEIVKGEKLLSNY